MKLNPNARVTVTGGGTGVGISALLDETTDIAMASRGIKFSEKMKAKAAGEELAEITIAYDALAVVVHPSNPVKQLTRRRIFFPCPVFTRVTRRFNIRAFNAPMILSISGSLAISR